MGYIKSLSIGLVGLGLYFGDLNAVNALVVADCGPHSEIIASLASQHGEAVVFQGVAPNEMLEVTINPKAGSWSLLITDPGERTCIQSYGNQHEVIEYEKPEEPTVGS